MQLDDGGGIIYLLKFLFRAFIHKKISLLTDEE
jgi:hypothetical protein